MLTAMPWLLLLLSLAEVKCIVGYLAVQIHTWVATDEVDEVRTDKYVRRPTELCHGSL